jgi:hypothetical protein
MVGLWGAADDVDEGLPEEPPPFDPEELPEFELSLSLLPVSATGNAMASTIAIMIAEMIARLVSGLLRILVRRDGLLETSAATPPALRSSSDNI